jgi:hypothetical protein
MESQNRSTAASLCLPIDLDKILKCTDALTKKGAKKYCESLPTPDDESKASVLEFFVAFARLLFRGTDDACRFCTRGRMFSHLYFADSCCIVGIPELSDGRMRNDGKIDVSERFDHAAIWTIDEFVRLIDSGKKEDIVDLLPLAVFSNIYDMAHGNRLTIGRWKEMNCSIANVLVPFDIGRMSLLACSNGIAPNTTISKYKWLASRPDKGEHMNVHSYLLEKLEGIPDLNAVHLKTACSITFDVYASTVELAPVSLGSVHAEDSLLQAHRMMATHKRGKSGGCHGSTKRQKTEIPPPQQQPLQEEQAPPSPPLQQQEQLHEQQQEDAPPSPPLQEQEQLQEQQQEQAPPSPPLQLEEEQQDMDFSNGFFTPVMVFVPMVDVVLPTL